MIGATHSYKQAQYNTVGRADIILMLYDGAIRFLDQAEEKIIQKDMQEKGNFISKVMDIIHELDAGLNMDKGAEIAHSLHGWYSLCTRNLLKINLTLDLELLGIVRDNLQRMRDTFAEAMQSPEAKLILSRMGPLPQTVSSNHEMPINIGNAIAERSLQVKQMQERADAITQAKQNLATATNDQDAQKAKQELQNLLKRNTTPTPSKQNTLILKQKAVQAFNRATPKTYQIPETENIKTPQATAPQGTATPQQATAPQGTETPQQAATSQGTATPQQATAPQGTETPQQAATSQGTATSYAPTQQTATAGVNVSGVNASNTVPPQEKPQAIPYLPNKSPLLGNSALMNKKMALYKNMNSG